jgi:hypothetical protein
MLAHPVFCHASSTHFFPHPLSKCIYIKPREREREREREGEREREREVERERERERGQKPTV